MPGRSVFWGYDLRIVDETRDAPHEARGVFVPGASVDFMRFKHFADIGGDAFDVVVVLVVFIKERIRKGGEHVFRHQFHDHVFGRAYQIEYVSQRKHVVKVLVRSERGILDPDFFVIGIIVPVLKVVHHGVFTENVTAFQVDDLIFAPVSFVDVFFPAADPEDGFAAVRRQRYARQDQPRYQKGTEESSRIFQKDSFHVNRTSSASWPYCPCSH